MAAEPQVALASHRWRPAPLMQVSLLAHGAMLLLVLVYWPLWPWALALLLADHVLLFTVGLIPRSRALGVNWTRLPDTGSNSGRVAITIDDGPDPDVTPGVLRILAAHGARATFFCIGERAERYPALVRACVQAGHAVENHSYHHRRASSRRSGASGSSRESRRVSFAPRPACAVPCSTRYCSNWGCSSPAGPDAASTQSAPMPTRYWRACHAT